MKSDHLCGISKCSVFVLNYSSQVNLLIRVCIIFCVIFVLLLCVIEYFHNKMTSLTYIELLLLLTEYCREEFEKFTTFLTSKSAKFGQFSGEIGQFSE